MLFKLFLAYLALIESSVAVSNSSATENLCTLEDVCSNDCEKFKLENVTTNSGEETLSLMCIDGFDLKLDNDRQLESYIICAGREWQINEMDFSAAVTENNSITCASTSSQSSSSATYWIVGISISIVSVAVIVLSYKIYKCVKKDKTEKNEETVGKTEKEKLIDSAKTDQDKEAVE